MKVSSSAELLATIDKLHGQGTTFAISTVVADHQPSITLLITEDGMKTQSHKLDDRVTDEIVTLARQTMLSGKATTLVEMIVGGEKTAVAIEVIRPKPSVIIFGAGHVGQAVGLMGNMIGYSVTVVDDREAFANRDRLPDPAITIKAEPFEQAAGSVAITSNTAIVIVTRGHQYDELCLRSVVESGARYIGMIGSRRRVISVFKQLTQSGIDRGLLDRVHAPIGLRIGARSPQEIAVAILAEIIQTFNGRVAASSSSTSCE